MSESDNRNEPHVSSDDLRAALAPRGEGRRNPVLVSETAASAAAELAELRSALDVGRSELDAARADVIELRAAVEASRGDARELRGDLATALADGRERRLGLQELASAGVFRRRRVVAGLRERGLL
jgi:hypothetical protein